MPRWYPESAAKRAAWAQMQRRMLQRDFSEIWIERNPPVTAGAATTHEAAPTLADGKPARRNRVIHNKE
jgi:hypothetical protein